MKAPIEKAKKIKLLILDVDGVLTDGKLYFSDAGHEYKAFHAQDGLGIKRLLQAGVNVAVITSRQSPIVERRMQALGVTHLYQGQEDKMIPYEALKTELSLDDQAIAYLGDDLPDLPLIKRCGLGVAVANAVEPVCAAADWRTQAPGGHGAARELCELILQSLP